MPREGAGLLLKRYRALVGPEIAPTGSFRFYFPAVWKWSQKKKKKKNSPAAKKRQGLLLLLLLLFYSANRTYTTRVKSHYKIRETRIMNHPLDCQGQIKANLITVVKDHLTQNPVDVNINR